MSLPSGAAILADGSIVIVDAGEHCVRVFSRGGDPLRTFGSLGGGEGDLRSPAALAASDDGLIYVADSGNDRIVMFSAAGRFLRTWGGRGKQPGQFCNPQGVTVAGDRVIVADTGNQRVQVFGLDGRFLLEMGGSGETETRLKRPVAVAMDERGRFLVVDSDRDSVRVFDADGQLEQTWGDYGPFAGLLNEPMGVTCVDNEALVVDAANHRIQFFDSSGEMVKQWGLHDPVSHEGDGRIHYPHSVAIAPDRSFAVLCEPLEHRCQIFHGWSPGEPQEPRQANLGGDQTHFGQRLTTDGRLMLIPEPEHHYIYVLDQQAEAPVMISQSGTRGTKFGQFMRPTGLYVNEQERIAIIADPSIARLQTFSLDFKPDLPLRFDPYFARFVRSIDFTHPRFAWPLGPDGTLWPALPDAIRCDPQGRLHVIDSRNAVVLVFDRDMNFLRAYGGYGSEPGQLRQPTDVAFNSDGSIAYVVDAGNFRVQAFDATGKPLQAFGVFGRGDGQFLQPFGVVVNHDGAVYVSDALADRVQRFDADGRFVRAWGSRGGEHGQFWRPMGLAIDMRGRLVVIDHGNHRAQLFSLDGDWLGTFGSGRSTMKSQLPE